MNLSVVDCTLVSVAHAETIVRGGVSPPRTGASQQLDQFEQDAPVTSDAILDLVAARLAAHAPLHAPRTRAIPRHEPTPGAPAKIATVALPRRARDAVPMKGRHTGRSCLRRRRFRDAYTSAAATRSTPYASRPRPAAPYFLSARSPSISTVYPMCITTDAQRRGDCTMVSVLTLE